MIAVAVAPSPVATATTGADWLATGQLATMKTTEPRQPVRHADDRAVERHLQRAGARHLGGGGITVAEQGVTALPAHHRDQQPQAQVGRDGERHEQVAEEDRQVEGGQVLQLDAILGWQPEAQEAQHEQGADDVGLQHAEREHRPRRARHPPDECADSPDRNGLGGHRSTVSGHGQTAKGAVGRTCRFAALLLSPMAGVFSRLVGQDAVEAELVGAAQAARGDSAHNAAGDRRP